MTQNNTQTKDYSKLTLAALAHEIRKDWKKPSPHAQPYLNAMWHLFDISDNYGLGSGSSIVAYFLANAHTWRGPVARAIKKELNRRLQASYIWR